MQLRNSLLVVILFLSYFPLAGQKTHTVNDPEITFSLEIPENWRVVDDGYVLAIIPPSGGSEYLDFTYYETSEADINKAFEFSILAFNGENELDAKIIDQGKDMVDEVEARWALLSYEFEGEIYRRLTYLLIKHGQYFMFRGSALPANFNYYRPIYESVIRSLNTAYTKN